MRLLIPVGVLALVVSAASASSSIHAQARPQPTTAMPIFTRVYSSNTPGLVAPVAVQKSFPTYTPQAMRLPVQGTVALELTVDTSGQVRDAMVTKSVDSVFGMDEQAVMAASKWVFQPGRLNGAAVAVRVAITFDLQIH